jgi:alpha-tubulin suppressor-like RCC1 family protein
MFSQIVHIWKDANNWRDRNEIILEDEIIEEVSIGERHIIIRTKNRILGIGSNSTGQLGLDDYDNFDQKACFRDFV